MKATYYIVIDCGVKTGLCVWSTRFKEIKLIETLSIHKAMDEVKRWHNQAGDIFVRIEDARLRTWIPYQKTESAERGHREGAGSVKRDAKIWEDFLTDNGILFELVAPKRNKTKVDAGYFNRLTGYAGRTSEHARDAAMLVVGM